MTRSGEGSSPRPPAEVSPLIANMEENTRRMQRGVRMALLIHKKLGHSIAVWDEERGVVVLPPEEIPVDDEEFEGEELLLPWW